MADKEDGDAKLYRRYYGVEQYDACKVVNFERNGPSQHDNDYRISYSPEDVRAMMWW